MTVAVPIENNGQPGEGDIVIPVSISAPSPGATLGSSSTADVVIQDNNPLSAPVTVTSLQVATAEVTVGSGKKTKTKTEKVLRLQFSGPITGVGNLAAYQLLAGKTTKTKRGKVTTFSKPVALASAVYDSTALTVTLYPASKLNTTQRVQLRITAAFLTDAYGRPLDGNDDGQPGGDFVGVLSG